MNWSKALGGLFFIVGLIMLVCIPVSYLDGYSEWWHFIPISFGNLLLGYNGWKTS